MLKANSYVVAEEFDRSLLALSKVLSAEIEMASIASYFFLIDTSDISPMFILQCTHCRFGLIPSANSGTQMGKGLLVLAVCVCTILLRK